MLRSWIPLLALLATLLPTAATAQGASESTALTPFERRLERMALELEAAEKSRAVKAGRYANRMNRTSATLMIDVGISQGLVSLIERDPLLLHEFVTSIPKHAAAGPAVLAIFHLFADPASQAVERRIMAYGGSKATQVLAGSNTGLVVGMLGTQLLFELISGDIMKYTQDSREAAKLTIKSLSLAGGGVTSFFVTRALAGAATVAFGASPPVFVLSSIGGVILLTTANRLEKWVKRDVLYKMNAARALGTARELEARLLELAHRKDPGAVVEFDSQLALQRQAWAASRSELLSDLFDRQMRYLKETIHTKAIAYQQVRRAEWLAAGFNTQDPDYIDNPLDWVNAPFPLQESITITLLPPKDRMKFIADYSRSVLENEQKTLERLDNQYISQVPRLYDRVLADPRFSGSFQQQLRTYVDMLERIAPAWTAELVKELREKLATERTFRTSFEEIHSLLVELTAMARKGEMSDSKNAAMVESLLATATLIASEYASHQRKEFYGQIVQKASERFRELLELNARRDTPGA